MTLPYTVVFPSIHDRPILSLGLLLLVIFPKMYVISHWLPSMAVVIL